MPTILRTQIAKRPMTAPPDRPAALSPAAERQRRYRERARKGLVVAPAVVSPDLLSDLMRAGLLAEHDAGDATAIGRAVVEAAALRVTARGRKAG